MRTLNGLMSMMMLMLMMMMIHNFLDASSPICIKANRCTRRDTIHLGLIIKRCKAHLILMYQHIRITRNSIANEWSVINRICLVEILTKKMLFESGMVKGVTYVPLYSTKNRNQRSTIKVVQAF